MEALGFELPDPDKPLSRRNNRKITFDAACRKMLFEIAKRHGLELEEEAEYGNSKYLEKQDFILAKQKEQLAVIAAAERLVRVGQLEAQCFQCLFLLGCHLIILVLAVEHMALVDVGRAFIQMQSPVQNMNVVAKLGTYNPKHNDRSFNLGAVDRRARQRSAGQGLLD